MTPDDMRAVARECYEYMDARMVNKLAAVLWECTAEICERLDRVENRSLKEKETWPRSED